MLMLYLSELMKKKNHFISEIWAINPQRESKAVAKAEVLWKYINNFLVMSQTRYAS